MPLQANERPLCEEKKESQQVRGGRAGVNGKRHTQDQPGTILRIVHNPVPICYFVYFVLLITFAGPDLWCLLSIGWSISSLHNMAQMPNVLWDKSLTAVYEFYNACFTPLKPIMLGNLYSIKKKFLGWPRMISSRILVPFLPIWPISLSREAKTQI